MGKLQTMAFCLNFICLQFRIGYPCLLLQTAIDNHFSTENVNLGLHHLDWANWLDVFTTSIFLVGMWFMAKRKIENWIFWMIGDFICIPMMLYKGLGITSVQYLVFTVMAYLGYLEWKKSIKKM